MESSLGAKIGVEVRIQFKLGLCILGLALWKQFDLKFQDMALQMLQRIQLQGALGMLQGYWRMLGRAARS